MNAPSLVPAVTRLGSGIRIVDVAHDDPRAITLRGELDAELDVRYGGRSAAVSPADEAARAEALRVHPEQLVATWVALDEGRTALGHLMLRRLDGEWELKRLIVTAAARGRGVARGLVAHAIETARDAGAPRVILQTGAAQPESLALYRSFGFMPIPVYEPYAASMPRSLCFQLAL